MKIETKFNVGDKFVAIKDGKAQDMVVQSIMVVAYEDRTNITYYPKTEGGYSSGNSFEEKLCFKSKEELIKSL